LTSDRAASNSAAVLHHRVEELPVWESKSADDSSAIGDGGGVVRIDVEDDRTSWGR